MNDPTIKPEWRTSTVVGLCQGMRQERDYSALPILADALQDADCDDERLLAILRGGGCHDPERLVALVLSEQTADAVRWLDSFAERLGPNYGYEDYDTDNPAREVVDVMDYAALMGYAREYVEHGETKTQYGSDSWRTEMYESAREFWAHFRLVTGTGPDDEDDSCFSCSC